MPPTRNAILGAMTRALEPLDHVHAFWEGGAAAFGRLDEWSDLDLYVVVDDEKVPETFRVIEEALGGVAPIRTKFEVPHPPPTGTAQAFYRLEGASEYFLVDLAILKRSAPDKYLEPEIHGPAVFYFNKRKDLLPPSLDADVFAKKAHERLVRLRGRMEIFGPFVQKEILRKERIEALDLYRGLVLDSLVAVLRMKHNPVHFDFRTRYVYHELPREVLQRLEPLYFVRDVGDLEAKYHEALAWFREVAGTLDEEAIRERMPSA